MAKKKTVKTDRFKIVEDPSEGCFLVDTDGELSSIPLRFSYTVLGVEGKRKLQEWITFLNGK